MMRSYNGMSLSEMLIALSLSSILLLAVIHSFCAIKQQYSQIESELSAHLDLMLVSQLIQDSIHKAGFTPCLPLPYLTTVNTEQDNTSLTNVKIDDGLHVYRMDEQFATVQSFINNHSLIIDNGAIFNSHQRIIIADCYHAEVQLIEAVAHEPGLQRVTLKKSLVFNYQQPTYMGRWLEESYFMHYPAVGDPALMYRTQHSEVLTTMIKSFSAEWISSMCRGIRLQFGLEKNRKIILDTAVRVC